MFAKMLKTLTLAIVFAGFAATVSVAAEITLKAVASFPKGSTFNSEFVRYVDKVNEEAKGTLQIKLLGYGAAVMHPFEMGKAVKDGVVDLCSCPSSFYTKLMPEAYAFKQADYTIHEMRKNGAYDYIEKITNEKLNAHWLGRSHEEEIFYIYLQRKWMVRTYRGSRSVPRPCTGLSPLPLKQPRCFSRQGKSSPHSSAAPSMVLSGLKMVFSRWVW